MKKVLLFNFYKGILYRGIPIYSDNLATALRKEDCIVKEWICPKFLHNFPRLVIDLFFVLSEQIFLPLICCFGGYDKVIYPYNSCSILSALTNKSLMVIHDFIPNKKIKERVGLSSLYIIITQRIHALFKRDVAFVSATTYRIGIHISWLKNCQYFLLPNAFYLLEEKLKEINEIQKTNEGKSCNYIVLISGNGKNKEFDKAMQLWQSSKFCNSQHLKVMGLGAHQKWANNIINSLQLENVEVLPVLSDDELIVGIKKASLIWVHSTHEGFGRPVIEGRMCGKNVIASNISAFREHKDSHVYLYNNKSFANQYSLACQSDNSECYEVKYHAVLEDQIKKWLIRN
ncbi:glycosyltransferase [Xenorhabdus bovienii]|uniref:WfbW n=1 Tax=Xenorhabdus bovienii str. Intermedium TaxID=1379677 RepID=A0A077QM47_XENBV|nr:glycosyltransferase [Xenorhabdus bovienii]CDH34420.1 WfbW [Xenorhabdus bovienii str. Intermedium]